MKKILLFIGIIGLAVIFLSCDKEDENCNCEAKYQSSGSPGYFYIKNLPIDCETGQPLPNDLPETYYFVKCK